MASLDPQYPGGPSNIPGSKGRPIKRQGLGLTENMVGKGVTHADRVKARNIDHRYGKARDKAAAENAIDGGAAVTGNELNARQHLFKAMEKSGFQGITPGMRAQARALGISDDDFNTAANRIRTNETFTPSRVNTTSAPTPANQPGSSPQSTSVAGAPARPLPVVPGPVMHVGKGIPIVPQNSAPPVASPPAAPGIPVTNPPSPRGLISVRPTWEEATAATSKRPLAPPPSHPSTWAQATGLPTDREGPVQTPSPTAPPTSPPPAAATAPRINKLTQMPFGTHPTDVAYKPNTPEWQKVTQNDPDSSEAKKFAQQAVPQPSAAESPLVKQARDLKAIKDGLHALRSSSGASPSVPNSVSQVLPQPTVQNVAPLTPHPAAADSGLRAKRPTWDQITAVTSKRPLSPPSSHPSSWAQATGTTPIKPTTATTPSNPQTALQQPKATAIARPTQNTGISSAIAGDLNFVGNAYESAKDAAISTGVGAGKAVGRALAAGATMYPTIGQNLIPGQTGEAIREMNLPKQVRRSIRGAASGLSDLVGLWARSAL